MEYNELKKKVLEVLNIDSETNFTDEELCQMLNKKRKNHHSDNNPDPELKEEYDKKFIEFNDLYKEFTRYKVKEKQTSEIAPIKTELDFFLTKQENIELEERIEKLKKTIEYQEYKIENLKDQISIISSESQIAEKKELIETLKPHNKGYLSTIGLITVLTIILNILAKLGEISNIISTTFQVNANYLLLSLFSFFCLIYFYQLIRGQIIKQVSLNIVTVRFSREFCKDKHSSFSEGEVFDYILNTLNSRKGINNWIIKNIFNIYNYSTIETFKKIFILELINKKVIRLAEVYGLERKFEIIRQYRERTPDGKVIFREF